MSPAETNRKIPKHSFVSRNLVTIVMVPALIGMHYGWAMLQENKSLVSDEEKIELPIVTAGKYIWGKIKYTAPDKEVASE